MAPILQRSHNYLKKVTVVEVSVALATHNARPFIREQLESILKQSVPVEEIVISDDASTDGTVDYIREIFRERSTQSTTDHESLPKLVLLENEIALGVTKNFEQAISHCTGSLIALADQDDIWRCNKVARVQHLFLSNPNMELLFTNALDVDESGNSLGYSLFDALEMTSGERRLVENGRAFEAFLRRNLATGATVVFRRELFTTAFPFPESWLHDEWLAMIAALFGGVAMSDEYLIDYRQHGNNQVGMMKMTLRQKLSRFGESRANRSHRLVRRAEALAEFARRNEHVKPDYAQMAQEKARFEVKRSGLPARRINRVVPVLGMAFRGQYRKFGTGVKDVVRSLIQPS